ncbi:calcium-activated chloride channel regulator 1-like isoform X2 [Tachypleus tridentatus]
MGKYQHNVEGPTKHNALCCEKSTWSVIKQNQDFIDGNNAPQTVHLSDVDFKYVQKKNLHIVIAFDSSGNMNPFEGSWHFSTKICSKSEQPLMVLITFRKRTTQKSLTLKA